MASVIRELKNTGIKEKKSSKKPDSKEENMPEEKTSTEKPKAQSQDSGDFLDLNDLGFVDHYGDGQADEGLDLLPENTAGSAINCAFIGVGGGGGKLAKSFLDLGYTKTLLINTTLKDQPEGVDDAHLLLLDGSDGVGKDVSMGQKIMNDNLTLVEDTLRSRVGKTDWLFICASGGGGTGSSAAALSQAMDRHLSSVQASGRVVYIVTKPTAQEMLNPAIGENYNHLLQSVQGNPYIVLDNEKQLSLLRGKVGMLGMYPAANQAFSRMLAQVLKMAAESSPIQSFDTQDLEKCLLPEGRIFLGTVAIRDFQDEKLGLKIYQGCVDRSPCPAPEGKSASGSLILIVSSETANDPAASNQMESAISYIGGRSDTQFSGVYVRSSVKGLVGICMLSGM
jgi:cell division GTPase FtsZ